MCDPTKMAEAEKTWHAARDQQQNTRRDALIKLRDRLWFETIRTKYPEYEEGKTEPSSSLTDKLDDAEAGIDIAAVHQFAQAKANEAYLAAQEEKYRELFRAQLAAERNEDD